MCSLPLLFNMIWVIIHSVYGTNDVLHVITISIYSRNRNKSNRDFYDNVFYLKCSSTSILMCFLHNLAQKLWLNINMTIIICSIISNQNTEWLQRWSSFDAAFNAKWAALRHWKHWAMICSCVNKHSVALHSETCSAFICITAFVI